MLCFPEPVWCSALQVSWLSTPCAEVPWRWTRARTECSRNQFSWSPRSPSSSALQLTLITIFWYPPSAVWPLPRVFWLRSPVVPCVLPPGPVSTAPWLWIFARGRRCYWGQCDILSILSAGRVSSPPRPCWWTGAVWPVLPVGCRWSVL